jgi:ribosomal protein S27E
MVSFVGAKCKEKNRYQRAKMDIIKCNKCGQVLISGRGAIAIFGKGTSIGCNKCGNTYIFGEEKKQEPKLDIIPSKPL